MICSDCAQEADGAAYVNPPTTTCPKCGRVVRVNGSGRLRKHATVNDRLETVTCPGSTLRMVGGHAACKGCDCHHKSRGAWRGR